ncbi:hypothetical protein BDC45DRAFT_90425 [Circinella umbellata]|nr:hypothetical protein BDC45DRAFT_90425 [Circinella umbellata]
MSNEHSLTIKEEENFYPGYQELSTFVLETENPTLEAFAYKYKHEIVKWNEYNNWTSYATVWSRRYLNKMSDLRPDVKTNTRCKKTIWQEIYLLREG